MKKRSTLLLGMLFAGLLQMQAQTDTAKTAKSSQAFTLDEAQKFALANSPVLKNSNLDLEIAKKKVWETTAIGLPQISGKLSASYILEMSSTIKQFSSMGSTFTTLYKNDGALAGQINNTAVINTLDSVRNASAGQKAATENEMRWGLTADLTVSQLIFSGAYLVGLQTTKAFKGMSELAITKSTKDLAESVSNAYHLVLVMQENKRIMESIYEQTVKTSKEMEAMYKSGFIEETAVDQIKLTANNLKNTLTVMGDQVIVSKNLLRLQMGLDMTTDIVLTEQLDNMMAQNIQISLLSGDLNLDKNIDFQLVQNATKLKELQLKYQKTTLLPDIAAFYQYDHPFNDKAMSFTPPQMIGAAVNIPIFGSGSKLSRIKQASLDLQKSKNTEFQVSQALQLSYSQAKTSYSSAINKLDANKESLDLSKRIYDKTLIKFKNGVSSSMELTQAQSQYLQAQSAYYTTVIELVNAKNALEKIIK